MTKYLIWRELAIVAIHFILWNCEICIYIYIYICTILKQLKFAFPHQEFVEE